MPAATVVDPVSILKDIEVACRESSTGLAPKVETGNEWSGVAFRAGDSLMLAPLGEVVEILTYPELTVVPNTCDWVRGIANIRGKLLPVVDMSGYLNGFMSQISFRSRVLVVDYKGVFSGLVVDEVIGLKHFPADAIEDKQPDIEESLRSYIRQGVSVDGNFLGIFSLHALAESPKFLQTAV